MRKVKAYIDQELNPAKSYFLRKFMGWLESCWVISGYITTNIYISKENYDNKLPISYAISNG